MHFDLTWVLSVFKFSRVVGNSDARNFRLHRNCFTGGHLWPYFDRNVRSRCEATFSIPNLKTEALASTSASIVDAGLNKVWRTKAPSRPGSQVPSVPLQKNNERPCPKGSKAFSPVPQPTAVPLRPISFRSSAVKGSESTQRNVGLDILTVGHWKYPFYSSSSVSSSLQVTLFDFLPNRVSNSPSQSLLFCPPSPPPKTKIIFNPEEVTIPLPPAPGPKSNLFGATYPVRSPDHEFPINTLPSPSLPIDHAVPSSLFPTQSSNTLSPLPISLFSLLAAPPPPELVIKIAGPEGYLNAGYHKSQISRFLLSRATEVANSLVVIWQLSHIDSGGRRGLISLKALFAELDEKVLDSESDRTALSRFSRLSITIPDQVKDVAPPYNDLPQPVKEDDSIDLANAMDLHEFAWHGDFVIFASKFRNLSFATLSCIKIKSSSISIEDAITVLRSCSGLSTISLGTIQSDEDSEAIMSLKSSSVERKALPNLTYLALESDVALHPLIRQFCWTPQVSLSLTLRKQGTASFVQALDSDSH